MQNNDGLVLENSGVLPSSRPPISAAMDGALAVLLC